MVFPRDFRRPKRAKVKKHLKTRGKRWANMGLPWLRSSAALGAYFRTFGECLRASALVVLHPCKFSSFRLFGAIAFLDCLQISVLRAFWGGFFGFMGARCIFGCLVAFVGLVGLYACNVRRLGTEKRNAAHFLGFIGFLGLLRSCCCFSWFVLLLLRSCCLWVSLGLWVVAFFPYRTKRKRSAFVLRSVFTRFWCLYFRLSNAIIAFL